MLRNSLIKIQREYQQASQEEYGDHPLANYVRNDFEDFLKTIVKDVAPNFTVKASVGTGRWTFVPWAGVFDPLVTDSAQEGYYVCYLFSSTQPKIYLTLAQGTTAVEKEFKKRYLSVLKERASLMRVRLPDYHEKLDTLEIDAGSLAYNASHALGKEYDLSNVPNEEELREDLKNALEAYAALTFRGGLEPSPEIEYSKDKSNAAEDQKKLTEARRYRLHRRIDRNSKASRLAKKHHGAVCQACDFDFYKAYGEVGKDYIEAHHRFPLSSLEEGKFIDFSVADDFMVLCANCHRMIHKMEGVSDLEAFKRHIKRTDS
jgi:5-methylcytosine-specific restriction enzyme A